MLDIVRRQFGRGQFVAGDKLRVDRQLEGSLGMGKYLGIGRRQLRVGELRMSIRGGETEMRIVAGYLEGRR